MLLLKGVGKYINLSSKHLSFNLLSAREIVFQMLSVENDQLTFTLCNIRQFSFGVEAMLTLDLKNGSETQIMMMMKPTSLLLV